MTAFELAQRFVGEIHEIEGPKASPFIRWCHECVGLGTEASDEIAWCSSFANRIAWLLRLPRSKSAAARSWLTVGIPVQIHQAIAANDIVILKRGPEPQPGPEVTSGAPGHVGLFAGFEGSSVLILGGNQGDSVSIARFPSVNILGVRRLS